MKSPRCYWRLHYQHCLNSVTPSTHVFNPPTVRLPSFLPNLFHLPSGDLNVPCLFFRRHILCKRVNTNAVVGMKKL